jgi:XTP/dITP diphosphohydrolase
MTKLLIATNNPGKIREYQEIFTTLPLSLTSLAAEGIDLDPAETGSTFEANARLKALAFAAASPWLTLADDSGLEIDALHGEPGVFSARYGNSRKEDHRARYQMVLEKMKAVPWSERTARFRCVVALALGPEIIGVGQGTVEGFIAFSAKGQGGFGYDPVFFIPAYGQTLAQLPALEKHRISHRGRAARAARPLIEAWLDNKPALGDHKGSPLL